MIPPYGLRHRPVPIARTWYSFRPRRPLKLGRPDTCGVCVDIERGLLGIRSGRGRMVTLLTNVAAVDLAGSGRPHPTRGMRRSRRDGYLRLGPRLRRRRGSGSTGPYRRSTRPAWAAGPSPG
jgi:hypothetical protein